MTRTTRKTAIADTIAYRLTQILRRLNEGEKLDPLALVEDFKVNLRTIQRDLNQRFAFLGLERKDGRYSVNRARLGTLSLADVERFANLAGLQGMHPRLSSGFLKDILDSRLQRVLLIRGVHYENLGDSQPLFEQLKHATQEHHVVSFAYQKADGAKLVEAAQPYGLVLQDGIWYLAATDAGRLKSYAITKISRLLVAPETFTPDADVAKKVLEEDSIWLNLQKSEVVLEVAPPAADYFLRQKLIGGQKIEKRLEGGSLIVSGQIAHPNQILPIVRQWIPSIRIISPDGMQAELESQLRAYLGAVPDADPQVNHGESSALCSAP
ncbi:helix-turn-helix transcriptional regulator [Simplicispira psychrophila]|uniref:helix-turn-helix transcriptional regulator n=1 Tax=Simplicispira psychrophila TaxID=80882 RepID=UPI000561FD58|nr:WYL domain-containing protein [Simplicispira psychrophila]